MIGSERLKYISKEVDSQLELSWNITDGKSEHG